MNAARLYETPAEFAEMMIGQLTEVSGIQVSAREEDPLLLDLLNDLNKPDEKSQISLHETYRVYLNTGDLNMAINYLNGVVRTIDYTRMGNEQMMTIDARYLYPAIRNERVVTDQEHMELLSEPFLPGLRMVFLEIKDNVVKMVSKSMLDYNPRFTEEKIRRIAKSNLRAEGWHRPNLTLTSPTRKSCTIDVYNEYPYPIDYQFFIVEIASLHMPESYVISYTNRRMMITRHTSERMDTMERACELVRKSKFEEVARRSCRVMPGPVSDRVYWVHRGKAVLLDLKL